LTANQINPALYNYGPGFFMWCRLPLQGHPRHPAFFLAAVGRYAPVPGTRFSCAPPSQAVPASPAPPPIERIHSWYGKKKDEALAEERVFL